MTTLLINKQIAFVGMPGEPFAEFQIDLRDRCPVRDCILLSHTNGYFDYFPTILAASQGGYGAGDSETYVAVGAGERVILCLHRSSSSDGGGLFLREVEKRIGILHQFAACFTDYRNAALIEHTVKELVAQRVYGLALGYEDLNDHE